MYATVEDVLMRYGDILYAMAGCDGDEELNQPPVLAALEEATAEIDAVLAQATRTVDRASPIFRRICIDLAVGGLGKSGAERADVYERRASEARKLLDSLSFGSKTDSGTDRPGTPASATPVVAGPSSDFRQRLEDF